jgi:hypothetical protein
LNIFQVVVPESQDASSPVSQIVAWFRKGLDKQILKCVYSQAFGLEAPDRPKRIGAFSYFLVYTQYGKPSNESGRSK